MSTVFILHGGKTSRESKENDLFYSQINNYVKQDNVHILMCLLARERDRWNDLLQRDMPKFQKQTKKNLTFSTAQDPDDLFRKLKEHDVLYVYGGDGFRIEPYYSQLGGLKMALDGKVYMGSSMGAFLPAKNYVLSLSNQAENEVHAGLGMVPLNILCHWNIEENKEKKTSMLQKQDPQTPVLLLDEEQFAVFAQ